MLCHSSIPNQAGYSSSPSSAMPGTAHYHHHNSSALYSTSLPPHQPLMASTMDSFSTPSSSTPYSLEAIRSWQQQTGTNNCSAATTPKQPLILDSLTASKVTMVETLVDTAALIIESIWPSPLSAQYSTKAPVIPLHIFVKETLRRSRTTLSTLQLALYYIYKVRNQVLAAQEKIRQGQIQHLQQHFVLQHGQPLSPNGSMEGYSDEEFRARDYFNTITVNAQNAKKNTLPLTPPGTNNTPASLSPLSLTTTATSSPILAKSEPVGCGRRMFLAALILASKFQQDRTYSNKAWSKISGLPVSEINLNEITFLGLIDYRLFVSQAVFQKWVGILTEKGRVRDRASLHRSNIRTDIQPARRSSIQYCNNTLPSRMTCVTASSLEQQSKPTFSAPHLPSFALFVGEPKAMQSSVVSDHGQTFQFDCTAPADAPVLPKLTQENLAAHPGTGSTTSDAPRVQQGMGAYMTHRWVQAQRREHLRSRMQAMGYASGQAFAQDVAPLSQQGSLSGCLPQPQNDPFGTIASNFQNNIVTYSNSNTYTLDILRRRTEQSQAQEKHQRDQFNFMPSPASSPSPVAAAAGSKRRQTEMEPELDARAASRRRLSVSFLVDC
ncbi:PHO85 cyclin-5 [Entomortierella parvispora]|uniref:PHO85 cyclin-5 n=1 Tax=Entomortierella parvispora TaxID=205924 RepID=A0A9P3HB82_9FUNG|nr:PHO85 cyclin-5 [Entomortierella parvispora]